MAPPMQIHLTRRQQHELEHVRAHHPKAYVRERASGILKVAAGQSVRQVALVGLLHPRDPETVSGWIARYRSEGRAGLGVRVGRGRKPAFFPPRRRSRTG